MARPATFRPMLEPMADNRTQPIDEALPEFPRCDEGPTAP